MTAEVGRPEFEAWTRRIEQNAVLLSSQAALSVQMTEVIKDVTDLRTDLSNHRQEHKDEVQRRLVSRRWAWGVGVALFAALESPLIALLTHH